MASITLINGETASVDDADLPLVAGLAWRAQYFYKNKTRAGISGVATGSTRGGLVLLHRFLLGAQAGEIVDHIDGDPLNNSRANLRICTHAQNMKNRKLNENSSSGVKGVYYDAANRGAKKWRATIHADGRRIRLGRFERLEDAADAYAKAAEQHHGEFARIA